MEINIRKWKKSVPKTIKVIAILIVFSMLSITWSSTIPTVKADGETPHAVIGFITGNTLESIIFEEYGAPFWIDLDDNSTTDVIAYKIDTGFLYCAKYINNSAGNDYYQWYPLINLPDAFEAQTRGEEEDWRLENIVPKMTNLQNINAPVQDYNDLIITNSWGPPKWFKRTDEINEYGLPEFDYEGNLPIESYGRALSFGDLNNDSRADIITTDSSNNLVYFENTGTEELLTFNGPTNVLDCNESQILFPQDMNVIPYLVRYDNDNDFDLIITSGSAPVVYYENTNETNETYEWTNRAAPSFLEFGCEFHKYIQFIDFNDELSGLTGEDYGTDDDHMEILAVSPPEIPFVLCSFNWIFESSGSLSVRVTEGEEFELRGEMSYTDPPGGSLTYDWDLDDGTEPHPTNSSITHSYETVDESDYYIYYVTLTVEVNPDHTDDITISVNVTDAVPVPVILGDSWPYETDPNIKKYTYNCTNSEMFEGDPLANATGIEWDITYNETAGFIPNATFTDKEEIQLYWTDEGEQCIALRLTDNDGSSAIEVMEIHVQNAKPRCELSLSSLELKTTNQLDEPLPNETGDREVTVYAYNITDPSPVDTFESYRYYWGDPGHHITETTNTSASFAYPNSGIFYIRLQVQDNDGAWSDYSNSVKYIIEDLSPIPSITSSHNEADEGVIITFDATDSEMPTGAIDTILYYYWDFDYDGFTFHDDGYCTNGTISQEFDSGGSKDNKSYDVAVMVIDSDGSSEIAVHENLTINDLSPDAHMYCNRTEANEGGEIIFEGYDWPYGQIDEIVEYQWDWNYNHSAGNFTVDQTTSMPEVIHVFDTLKDGEEHSDTAKYNVAVKLIDSDGSESIAWILNIDINDEDPVAVITGPEYGSTDNLTWFDASLSSSAVDKIVTYEWDFSYDENEGFLIDDTTDIPQTSNLFEQQGYYEVAVRVIEEHFDMSEINSYQINIMGWPTAFFETEVYVDEGITFILNGSLSNDNDNDCDPHNNLEFYWDVDGDDNEDFSEVGDVTKEVTEGMNADDNFNTVDGEEGRYALYPMRLKVERINPWAENKYSKNVLIKDAEPTKPIDVDLDVKTVENNGTYYVAKELGGKVYTAPGAQITFNASEVNYCDDPVVYDWDFNYCGKIDLFDSEGPEYVGANKGSVTYSWNSEGVFTVAVKKVDDDGSEVILTKRIFVVQDNDDDGLLDDYDDQDDDNDGVMDGYECHTKVFKTDHTYPINDHKNGNNGYRDVPLYYEKPEGEIVSVTANIGIKHQKIGDLKITLKRTCRMGTDVLRSPNSSDNSKGLYESYDLLRDEDDNVRFSNNYFQESNEWSLLIMDTVNGNIGFVEYFEIEVVHRSDPYNNDTDGDGVSDWEELNLGVDGYISDPCVIDTDGDGWNDDKELEEGTDPTASDTDGDTVIDSNDLDPLHDVMIKLNIHAFQLEPHDDNNDIYFKGKIGDRKFQTIKVNDAVYETEVAFSNGVYYYNIPDHEKISGENAEIDIQIWAMDRDDGNNDDVLDCSSGGDDADFVYIPATGQLSGDVNGPADNWMSTCTEGGDIKVWFTITKTYAEKIHTYLVASDDIYYDAGEDHEDEQGMVYTGDDQFYVFLVDQTTSANFYYRYYAFIVPKSIYFGSKFYAKTIEENLSHLYLGIDNDDEFITRDFDSKFAPRSVEGFFKLKGVNGSPIRIDNLKQALTHNETDVSIANLTLLTSSNYDDSHSYENFIHTIGLPSAILGMIPNGPKRLESPVKHYKDNNGWYDSLTSIKNKAWKCVATAAEYLKDFATLVADIGFELVHKMLDAATEIADAVVDAFNALYNWIVEKITGMFEGVINKVTSALLEYVKGINNTINNFIEEVAWFDNANFCNASNEEKEEHLYDTEVTRVAVVLSILKMEDKATNIANVLETIIKFVEPFTSILSPFEAFKALSKVFGDNFPDIERYFNDMLQSGLNELLDIVFIGNSPSLIDMFDIPDLVSDLELEWNISSSAIKNWAIVAGLYNGPMATLMDFGETIEDDVIEIIAVAWMCSAIITAIIYAFLSFDNPLISFLMEATAFILTVASFLIPNVALAFVAFFATILLGFLGMGQATAPGYEHILLIDLGEIILAPLVFCAGMASMD